MRVQRDTVSRFSSGLTRVFRKAFSSQRGIKCYAAIILALLSVCAQSVYAKNDSAEETYTVWKDGQFHRFVVDKHHDFSQYQKLIIFPLNIEELVIDPKTKKRLRRNWEDFPMNEMKIYVEKFSTLVEKEFDDVDGITLTEKGGKGVLAVEFRAIKMTPRTFRDSSASTVGSESFEIVGSLQYQVVMLNSATREVVAMIDDDLQVALRRRGQNNRNNQARAWSLSMAHMLKRFQDNFIELQQASPLK